MKFELMPAFLRAMQTPSKAWMRSRSPSTTRRLTRTVSPGWNGGTGRLGDQLGDLLGFELLQKFIGPPLSIARRLAPAPPT